MWVFWLVFFVLMAVVITLMYCCLIRASVVDDEMEMCIRDRKMLFPDEPMGEEKYILYADLSDTDIGTSDFKSMDGKRVGVLMGTESEIMLTAVSYTHLD